MDSNLNQLAPINFNDGFILGQQPHESGFRASTFEEFSKWLNVRLDLQGAELIDPTAPGTAESPAIITAGPEDRKGKFEPAPGFYQGFPEIKEGNRYYFYWNKMNWSLWDLGGLPVKQLSDEEYMILEKYVQNGSAVINEDGVLTSVNVRWLDGELGSLVYADYNRDFMSYDSYSVTYKTKTLRQPKVTRDLEGNIISKPLLIVE